MIIEVVKHATKVRKRERYQVRLVEETNGEPLLWSEKYANRQHALDLAATLKKKTGRATIEHVGFELDPVDEVA